APRRTRRIVAGEHRHAGHLCRPGRAHRMRRPAHQNRIAARSNRNSAMADNQNWQPLGRDELAMRVAQDIPEGWSVNLGIGIPTLVANYVPAQREVIFHSENGILGMGPAPTPESLNPWLVNASRQHVTLRPGASLMNHADSFALVRGGHLDLCVLGACQWAENGDIPIWARAADETPPAL